MSSYLLQKARPCEDALTGLFVDLLRAWPTRETLLALLGAGTSYPTADATWQIPVFDEVSIEPWPAWKSGEPDVALSFRRGGAGIWRVILEAKLGAGKSGMDDEPVGPSDPTQDQLAKYQREAVQRWPDEPVTVVYLTHDALLPEHDLKPSLAAMSTSLVQGSSPRLMWCSWRDVEQALRSQAELLADGGFRAYAGGMADVLRSAGMFRFRGQFCPPGVGGSAGAPPSILWWKPGPHRTRYIWQAAGKSALCPRPTRLWLPQLYRWKRVTAPAPAAGWYKGPK